MRNILITSALLYANGPLHMGHLVEYIQTDIFSRFQKMRGHQCLYICGSDAHGAPIMINAQKKGVSPEQLITDFHQQYQQDFADFYIAFDGFESTHSNENKQLVYEFYQRIKARGDIQLREVEQAYDPVQNMFLPDRYIKGECPQCGEIDQYGDHCEKCSATYEATDLRNPRSILSGAKPVLKKSEHYFFNLPHYEAFLKDWVTSGHLQKAISHKLNEWFEVGLKAWDISRDAPYFGFEIPGAEGKYFYVWLDAPIGYLSCLQKLDAALLEEYWSQESKAEVYHFIGKDIVYFHALFWPALLKSAGFRTPTNVFCHGFLTINGEKMSKSRGTFITARDYLNHLDPEALRYYYAAKLGDGIDDIDLNLKDFLLRVNSDLVGKVVNIASRSAGFINKMFDGQLADQLEDPDLFKVFTKSAEKIAGFYESRNYNQAVREIMLLADKANRYIDDKKPWVLAKEADRREEVQQICTMAINCFKILMTYLKPILPKMAEKTEQFLNSPPLTWEDGLKPLLNHNLSTFKPLMQRIQQEQIEALENHGC